MAKIRTVDFLPEYFKTPNNEKFLGSTLDQLVQEPNIKRTQGYIGQPWGPGVTTQDVYIPEIDKERQDYQLEPAVVFVNENQKATDFITYQGYLDSLVQENGTKNNPVPLFKEQFYSWAPFVDLDKLLNYSQYYWLPDGPEVIDLVRASEVSYNIDRNLIGQKNYNTLSEFVPNNVEFTNGMRIRFNGAVVPARYTNRIFVVEGVGNSIQLIPWEDLTVPQVAVELQNPPNSIIVDQTGALATTNYSTDYITIKRNSNDLNSWSRANRWVHIDVISLAAELRGDSADVSEEFRAQRPIVEFDAGLRIFNYGTEGLARVGLLVTGVTNAFGEIAGQTSYTFDGVDFTSARDLTCVFPNDTNPDVANKVWRVEYIEPSTDMPSPPQPVLNLVDTGQRIYQDSAFTAEYGASQQGRCFRFDNGQWISAQTKTISNQFPLFDLYDANGVSFADPYVYPSSDFEGSYLFNYRLSSGNADRILGFTLVYGQLGGIGDIEFEFYLYTEEFSYVSSGVSVPVATKNGFVRDYSSRTDYSIKLGYETIAFPAIQYQVFNFPDYSSDQGNISLDVAVSSEDNQEQPVKISVNNVPQDTSTYSVDINTTTGTTTIVPQINWGSNAVVNIQVLSEDISQQGYFRLPKNLEVNPLNQDLQYIKHSAIRPHFISGCRNRNDFRGSVVGSNNVRDLYDLAIYCTEIVQHSAPVPISGLFLRDRQLNLFDSLDYNSREYEKFKQILLQTLVTQEFINQTPAEILDAIIAEQNRGRGTNSPFYWTDMLPNGNFSKTVITYFIGAGTTYDTLRTYDFGQANYQAISLYLTRNSVQTPLIRGIDYEVGQGVATVTVTKPLINGDVIEIREYDQTWGSFVPATPTKLGLYPRFTPAIYEDTTFINPTTVIRGHDGSITPAFGDIRDDVLYEFETRVYNNIKVNNEIPFLPADVLPGKFRDTGTQRDDVDAILHFNFLLWIGLNKTDYQIQNYFESEQFSWNYRSAVTLLGDSNLPGAWRGIYQYYYDTTAPHLRPWEMLGFSEEPVWWTDMYGTAPYTRGNYVLWDDIRDGFIREPGRYRTDVRYQRPEIYSVLPVDQEGNLLSPLVSVIRTFDPVSARRNWIVGDMGPTEAAWRRSSTFAFTMQKLYALLRPSQYFTYCIDRDLYRINHEIGQWTYQSRRRLTNQDIQVYDGANGIIKNSYINFIVEYNKVYGIETNVKIQEKLESLTTRLVYRMAGFSDKKYLRFISDRSAPNSTNRSLLIPEDNYSILLYQNAIFQQITFSAINILQTNTGYEVSGNGITKPYFRILRPVTHIGTQTKEINNAQYSFPQLFEEEQLVPYGQRFDRAQQVIDFICGYGAWLEAHGVIYERSENSVPLSWQQMAEEFVYWSVSNWGTGSLYQLNPNAENIKISRPGAVAVSLLEAGYEDKLIDQNRQPLSSGDYIIDRRGNDFELTALTEKNIGYFNLKLTSYEHAVVFDNITSFSDIIYDSFTGLRQNRLLLRGVKSGDWNGTLDAPGFLIYQQNVSEWRNTKRYNKGEIVNWKGSYFQANKTVYPSENFNYTFWTKLSNDLLAGTLLPNPATKAQQSAKYYDKFYQNLDGDADLLGYGVTGFRPREYMDSIELDLVSQINVYNDFIRTKGTFDSLDYFRGARVDNNLLDYYIHENWAVQQALFGSTDVNASLDFELDQVKLTSNPATLQLAMANTVTPADQTIYINNIYDSTFDVTGPNVFPILEEIDPTIPLPTAGYVNAYDVDFQLFDFSDIDDIKSYINEIEDNDTIWVARKNSRTWTVYKCQQVYATLVQVQDNLSGQCKVIFTDRHNVSANEYLIIRYLEPDLDGIYKVRAVLDPKSVLLDLTISTNGQRSVLQTQAVALVLREVRIAQDTDIPDLLTRVRMEPGNRIWIDQVDGRWQVLERQQPYSRYISYDNSATANSQFGTSSAVSQDRSWTLVGSPGTYISSMTTVGTVEAGAVYLMRGNNYSSMTMLPPVVFYRPAAQVNRFSSTRRLGTSIAARGNEFAAVAAPGTVDTRDPALDRYGYVVIYQWNGQSMTPYQLLPEPGPIVAATGTFGDSMSFSEDENFLSVSDAQNRVSIYRRVPYQYESVTVALEQDQRVISYRGHINIEAAGQIVVFVSGVELNTLLYSVDVSLETVNLSYKYETGTTVRVAKRTKISYPGASSLKGEITRLEDYLLFNALFDPSLPESQKCLNPGVLKVTSPFNNLSILRHGIDYFIMPMDTSHSHPWIKISAPYQGQPLTVDCGSYFQLVETIESTVTVGYGQGIDMDKYGDILAIGNIRAVVNSDIDGVTEIWSRSQQRFEIYSDEDANSWYQGKSFYLPSDRVFPPVRVNGELTWPAQGSVSQGPYSYSYDDYTQTGTITFSANTLSVGDSVTIDSSHHGNAPIQILTVIDAEGGTGNQYYNSNFGYSIAVSQESLYLLSGAPSDSRSAAEAGSVSYFLDPAQLFGSVQTAELSGNITVNAGDAFLVDGYKITFTETTSNAQLIANQINLSWPANLIISATVSANRVTIADTNPSIRLANRKLTVRPYYLDQGLANNAYYKLGFEKYQAVQRVESPTPSPNARFGQKISISDTALRALIFSLNGSALLRTEFDSNNTTFDAETTDFDLGVIESGSVEYFELFGTNDAAPNKLPQYAYTQQLTDPYIKPGDRWGAGMDINGAGDQVIIGSPRHQDRGRIVTYADFSSGFKLHRQQPVTVDSTTINSISLYDKETKIDIAWLDYLDPLQGRILGAAQENLDFISAEDPARYNVNGTNNIGISWTEEYVGKMWWNLTNVRFIDYRQGDVEESSALFGTLFPGSSIDVYRWTASPVAPSFYPGPGTVYSLNSYVIYNGVDDTGKVVTTFYYWVKGITARDSLLGKTLSPESVARYIADPRASGIAFAALLSPSAFAVYNVYRYLNSTNTILHIDYDRQQQDENIYVEYDLLKENDGNDFVPDQTYQKLVDSFSGIDRLRLPVPDPALGGGKRYGISFRPRQTMFRDRLAALKNYVLYVNSILLEYNISGSRSFDLLNDQELPPEADELDSQGRPWWNLVVEDIVALQLQNFYAEPLGFRYLVLSDATMRGNWSIYETHSQDNITRSVTRIRSQTYNTTEYWNFTDWYQTGFDKGIKPDYVFETYNLLDSVENPTVGLIARISDSDSLGFSIYQYQQSGLETAWVLVGQQNGTIQISSTIYDYSSLAENIADPLIETRNIVEAINRDLLVGDLLEFKNRALTLTFRYIVSEQPDVNWLFKTSLIDVAHPVGDLQQSATYKRDNQDFVLDYTSEVKPYHVQFKDFTLIYTTSQDSVPLASSDFDVPAFFDKDSGRNISPILDQWNQFIPGTNGTRTTRAQGNSSYTATDPIWASDDYTRWFNNWGLRVADIAIANSGTEYDVANSVISLEVDSLVKTVIPADFRFSTDANGNVIAVTVVNPGLYQPNIADPRYANANNFSNSIAYANLVIANTMGAHFQGYVEWTPEPVRAFNMEIKYDRVNIGPTFTDWKPYTVYLSGNLVRFAKLIWKRNDYRPLTNEGGEFDFDYWISVPAGSNSIDGVDRTYGYSDQDANLNLTGLNYPGVKLGRKFVGTYDTTPYSTDPFESDYSSLDTLLSGGAWDTFVPSPNNSGGNTDPSAATEVAGGAFVDTYSSYAPEELTPGSTFDTLDLRVHTSPGRDISFTYTDTKTSLGWSSQVNSFRWYVRSNEANFNQVLNFTQALVVNDVTNSRVLVEGTDYTVAWNARNIEFIGLDPDTYLEITCYAAGGGFQLYRSSEAGLTGNTFTVDVPTLNPAYVLDPRVAISTVLLVSDGVIVENTFSVDTNAPAGRSNITVADGTVNDSRVDLVVLGFDSPNLTPVGGNLYSWSLPSIETVLGDGNSSYHLNHFRAHEFDNNQVAAIVQKDYLKLRGSASQSRVISPSILAVDVPYQTDVISETLARDEINVWVNGSMVDSWNPVYNERTDLMQIVFDSAPADSNIIVSVATNKNANYIIDQANSDIYFDDTVMGNFSVISWNDARQQQFDTRSFVGQVYQPIDGHANNLNTNGRWLGGSNVIHLGFLTSGIWFGNTIANISVLDSNGEVDIKNVTVAGMPYAYESYDSIPFNLANVVIVNAPDEGEVFLVPGDRVFVDGQQVLDVYVDQPRRYTYYPPGAIYPVEYVIPHVTPFFNDIGQQQYAVTLTQPMGSIGRAWNFTTNNSQQNLYGLVYSNSSVFGNSNNWIAVGSGGNVLTSTDGNIWNFANVVPNISVDLYDVKSNGNIMMAVGQDGAVLVSNNSQDWQYVDTGGLLDLYTLAYADANVTPEYVYLGDEFGNILVTANTAPYDEIIVGVVGWLAGGQNGRFIYSGDGMNWAEGPTLTGQNINRIVYNTTSLTSISYLALTNNGDVFQLGNIVGDWNRVYNGEDAINDVVRVGGIFYAVGDRGLVLEGTNSGQTWQKLAGAASENFFGDGVTRTFATSTVRAHRYVDVQVRVGDQLLVNGVDYSVDTINPVSITIGGRNLTPEQYAATIPPPPPAIQVTISGHGVDLNSITYDTTNSRLMATGDYGVIILSGDRGRTWQQRISSTSANVHGLVYSGFNYLAVGTATTTPATYQKANVEPAVSALIMNSPRGADPVLEFIPDISNLHPGQLVTGDFIRHKTLVETVDYANNSITVDDPLHQQLRSNRVNVPLMIREFYKSNDFDLGHTISNPDRFWITVDGQRLFDGVANGYQVLGNSIRINRTVNDDFDDPSNSSVVQILTSSDYSVYNELDFMVWKDMRENKNAYRNTPNNATRLSSNLSQTDDVIYVDNSSVLLEPTLGKFGLIMVGDERIAYRYRDRIVENYQYYSANGFADYANTTFTATANCVSGLLRGLAGTSQTAHDRHEPVVDININNVVPVNFQDYTISYLSRAVGSDFDQSFRSGNVANVRVVFPRKATPTIPFEIGDLVQSRSNRSSYDAGPVPILSAGNLIPDPGKNRDFQFVTYANPGANLLFDTQSGNIFKVDYHNPLVAVVSNSQIRVSIAGTEAENPRATFYTGTANLQQGFIANTADIPGQSALNIVTSDQVYVTLDGGQIVDPSGYQVANVAPLILEFYPNTLPADANIIVVAENQFKALSLSNVSVLLNEPQRPGLEIEISVEQGKEWLDIADGIPLQEQNTSVARFFKDQL